MGKCAPTMDDVPVQAGREWRDTAGVTDSETASGQEGGGDLASAVMAIIIDDQRSAEDRVTELVKVLDRAVFDALLEDRDHGIEEQILVRAVVAVGPALLEQVPVPTIAATLAAAEAYVRAPGDETKQAYFQCATSSYPYGSGEGHYGLAESCEPGSGCITGAGTLLSVGRQVGFGVVIEALAAELVPWLRALAGQVGTTEA